MGTLSKKVIKHHTQIEVIPDAVGKSIEEELRIATANKQPIEGGSPEIYTPYNEGVLPQYDPRTDTQELALDALDKVDKSKYLHKDEMPEEEPKQEQQETDTTELDF